MTRKLGQALANVMQSGIPLVQSQLETMTPAEIFQLAGAALEGVRETGANTGPVVNEIEQVVQLSPGDSWCMAAVQAALRFAENTTGKASTIYASGSCLDTWDNSPKNQISKSFKPNEGDIIIYQHGSTRNGHTEIVIKVMGTLALVMGGNTSAAPGVNANGDGEYFRIRSLTVPAGDMHIVGYLRPFV